ncbi:MAG: hypothetical protein WBA97_36585 [Actinophytocola sp.]|uniref:hypothetical protein n=1 Tax=Actinophytocola sp. TaxID=1872138 RepID=UPI003C73BCE3
MLSNQSELVWDGRIHLGDEPGIYGDTPYSGLALELPITLEKTDPAAADATALILRTENVETFTGYPGHLITVTAFVPDPNEPFHSVEQVLATERITSADQNRKKVELDLTGLTFPVFVGVRVRIDTEVPPGLYDDFVVTKLRNKSTNFGIVASFGFHA